MDDEDEVKLYFAITSNNIDRVHQLIKAGIDVNVMFNTNNSVSQSVWSPLHLCCAKGNEDCAKMLLSAGAHVNAKDKWSQTALMCSIITEWLNMLKLMLDQGADVTVQDQWGRSAIHLAINCTDDSCLQVLQKAQVDLEAKDILGRTALWHAAAEDGHLVHMRRLLAMGADINVIDAKDNFCLLQAAIRYSSKDRQAYVKMLLEAQTHLDARDAQMTHAAFVTLIQHYWGYGVSVTGEERELAQLLVTRRCGVKLCIHQEARGWSRQSKGTALHLAIHRGALSYIGLLLDAGADPDVADEDGVTGLHLAVVQKKLAAIHLLLTVNCSLHLLARMHIDGIQHTGVTPFRCALLCGHGEAAQLLVHAGYDLTTEHYLITNQNVPDYLLQNKDMLEWLQELVINPLDLKVVCRKMIRYFLGHFVQEGIQKLSLPSSLKDYLFLRV